MAERHVVRAAGGELLLADRVVLRIAHADLAVQADQIPEALALFTAKAAQQRPRAPRGEGRAPDRDAERLERHAGDRLFGEHVHVLRQLQPRPGRLRRIEIVVAGGDEHRHAHGAEAQGQLLPRLVKGLVAVEQVARQQDELHPLARHQRGQPCQQLPLLAPAHGRLARRQPLKGRVEMQVGRVQDLQSSHVSLTPSAARQRPVSVSMVNRQPSSLLLPLPAS